MPYTTLSLLQDRFGESELIQLTDKATPRTGAIVVSVVDKAIADADAEIDGFVGVRYAVPLPEPTPPVLVPIACDIARYRLYGNAVPDIVRQRYEDAVARLKDIAAGRMVLGVDPISTPTVSTGVLVRSPERVFSADALRDY